VVVALLAAAESGAFVGLVLPGEAAMLLGGFLVFQGQASLSVMLVCGIGGAIVGDSVSYWIGRTAGPRLMDTRLGRSVGEKRWERARSFVRARGGRAVFIGRFVGVLRALVPALAGSAGVPYREFLPYSLAGASAWAGAFILLGSVAGGSWHLVDRWAGRASLILAAILVAIGCLWICARWIGAHRDEFLRRWQRFIGSRAMTSLRRNHAREITFLRTRFDRTSRFGLYLTVAIVLMIGTLWIFGALIEALEEREDIYVIDAPVVDFFVEHRSENLTIVMKAITHLGGSPGVALILTIAAVVSVLRTRDPRWGAFFAAAMVGGLGLDNIVKAIVDRLRPPEADALVEVAGSAFPSGHSSAAAAMCAALAFFLTRRTTWKRAVVIWIGAAIIAALVGVSRVYLGAHWPTDVFGGFALGSFWIVVVATGIELLRDFRDDRRVAEPRRFVPMP
jgi:membrane protein DedA with SNARE-associated domain/membrane-associated phospholipid phosphatase